MTVELFVESPGSRLGRPDLPDGPALDMPFTAGSRPTGNDTRGNEAFISDVEERGFMREHAGSDWFENVLPGRRPHVLCLAPLLTLVARGRA